MKKDEKSNDPLVEEYLEECKRDREARKFVSDKQQKEKKRRRKLR